MASCDYKLCDICNSKVFYDADLNYETPTDVYLPFKEVGEKAFYTLDNLGDWAVLCLKCSKTHKTAIIPIESAGGVK